MSTAATDSSGGPQSTLRSLSLYTVAQGLNTVVPICTMPIFARLISPGEYGIVDMLTVVMIVGIGLGNWGLHTAFDRFFFAYSKDPEKREKLLGSLVGFSSVCLLAVCCAAFALRGYLSAKLTGVAAWGLLMMMVLASGALRHLLTFFLLHYRNAEQPDEYVKYDLLRLFVSTGMALVLVAGFELGIFGIAAASLAAHAGIFLGLVLRFGIRRCFKIDLAVLKECLLFSWPLMGKVLQGVLNVTIDKYMIGTLASMAALGVYGRANSIAYVVFALMVSVYNVYLPKWNKVLFGDDKDKRDLGRLFTEHVCITILPAVLLISFGHEVIGILLPAAYHSSRPLVTVLALYYSLLAFGLIQGTVMAYLKMTKFAMLANFVRYGLNVALNLILIPRFRAMGAVCATLAVGIIHISMYAVVLGKRQKINYERMKLAALYGGLACCAAAALCCQWSLVSYVEGLLLRAGLLVAFMFMWVRVVGLERIAALAQKIGARARR